MEDDAVYPEDLGQQLYEAGWRQGSLFSPGEARLDFLAHEPGAGSDGIYRRPLLRDERLVLVTQECDLIARTSTEPWVEALLCYYEQDKGYIGNIERTSARAFLVDPETQLVALARYRVTLHKSVLAGLRPEPWPSGSERYDRFVGWLGRRFTRPAVHDDVVRHFQNPVDKLMREIQRRHKDVAAVLTSSVYELRLKLPEVYEFPLRVHVVMMIKGDELSELMEEEADALTRVEQEIRDCLDPTKVQISSFLWRTQDQMSVAEYFATVPLFLDYLTYRGDELHGLKPLPPA